MALVGTIASSLAWLSDKANIGTNSKIGGSSDGAYFAYGDGTAVDDPSTPVKEGPYGIETARQLYNLAWLQYFGYFNEIKNNTLTPTYFELNADIDMTGWVLPPIGTETKPFVGVFNGNSHTVSNLVTSNDYDQIIDTNKVPGRVKQAESISNVNIVGMFGVVGNYNGAIPQSVTYDSQVTTIKDFNLNNASISSVASETLIGIVAGYVNATISGVGVQDSKINEYRWVDSKGSIHNIGAVSNYDDAGFDRISEYGVVGFCEDKYKSSLKTLKTNIYNTSYDRYDYVAKDEGDQQGWGGSIDMKTTYDGLHLVWDTYDDGTGRKYYYPSTRTYVEDINGNVVTDEYGGTNTEFAPDPSQTAYRYFSYSQYAGANETKKTANYTLTHNTGTDRFMYIYGKNELTQANAITATKTTYPVIANCFYISYTDNNSVTHHLTKNGNNAVNDQTNPDYATSWNVDESNHIYTTTDGDTFYYLVSNNTSLSLTTNANNATVWEWNGTRRTFSHYGNDGYTYYLFYDNGWTLKSIEEQYYTFLNNGRYLATSGTDIAASSTVTLQARWYLDGNGYYQYYNGVRYYLCMYIEDSYVYVGFRESPEYYFTYTNQQYISCSFSYGYRNYTAYIFYSSGTTWSISLSSSNSYKATRSTGGGGDPSGFAITRDTSAPDFKARQTRTNVTEDYKFTTEDTYFPLRQETGTMQVDGYVLSYTNNGTTYYMVFDANATNGLKATQDINKSTLWLINNNGYCQPQENENYWLNYGTTIQCTATTNNRFTYTDNTLRYRISNNNYAYAYYNGTQWATANSSRTVTRTNQTRTVSDRKPNGIPKDTNTGYIIGGKSTDNMAGTIRVSQYLGIGNNSPSLQGVTNGAITTMYTIKSDNMSSSAIDLNNMDTYQKLSASKTSLERVLNEDKTWIYGLHFMQSDIEYGTEKSAKVPYAKVNGDEKTNYELPTNCIDFNLKEKGYINFIAGAYFYQNNCFFTIEEIQRDDLDNIVLIRPIKAIYSDNVASHSYIYEYETYDDTNKRYSTPFMFQDGVKKTLSGGVYTDYSSQSSLTTGYSSVFNCKWINGQASLQTSGTSSAPRGYAYYFEVPMNIGEYAMGAPSFSGAKGAYLMYLDIGANAKKINRAVVTEYYQMIENISEFALGVGFVVAAGNTVSDMNSFCVTIKESYSGLLEFDRTAAGEAYYKDSTNSSEVELVYRYGTLVVKDGPSGTAQEPATETTTTHYRRMTYFDYNSNSDSTNVIIITDKKVNNGSWERVSIKKYKNYNYTTGQGVEDSSIDIYDSEGYTVDNESTIVIDESGCSGLLFSFDNYYPGVGKITITLNLSMTTDVDPSTMAQYAKRVGYIVSVVLTTDDGTVTNITSLCKVINKGDGTYSLVINGTTITQNGQEITIELTTGS